MPTPTPAVTRLTRYLLAAVAVLLVANLTVWSTVALLPGAGKKDIPASTAAGPDARAVCKHDIRAAIEYTNQARLGQMDLPDSCYPVVDDVQPIFDELLAAGVALQYP